VPHATWGKDGLSHFLTALAIFFLYAFQQFEGKNKFTFFFPLYTKIRLG